MTLAALRYTDMGSGSGHIELVNGEHVAPMIVRADGQIEEIADGDLPVGLFDFAQFHVIDLKLSAGDRRVLVTDGLTEAEDEEGNQFGAPRLHQHIRAHDPIASVFSAIDRFCEGASLQDYQTRLTIQTVA